LPVASENSHQPTSLPATTEADEVPPPLPVASESSDHPSPLPVSDEEPPPLPVLAKASSQPPVPQVADKVKERPPTVPSDSKAEKKPPATLLAAPLPESRPVPQVAKGSGQPPVPQVADKVKERPPTVPSNSKTEKKPPATPLASTPLPKSRPVPHEPAQRGRSWRVPLAIVAIVVLVGIGAIFFASNHGKRDVASTMGIQAGTTQQGVPPTPTLPANQQSKPEPTPSSPPTTEPKPEPKPEPTPSPQPKLEPKAEPQPQPNSEPQGVVDLLSSVNLKDVVVKGNWHFAHGRLHSAEGEPISTIVLPCSVPKEYSLTLVAERLSKATKGHGVLGVRLIGAGQPFLLAFDLSGNRTELGGKVVYTGPVFPHEKQKTVVCICRRDSLVVKVNGKTIIDWKGDYNSLTPDHGGGGTPGITIHTRHSHFAIDKAELRPLRPGDDTTASE
jgi:hypothetical protein